MERRDGGKEIVASLLTHYSSTDEAAGLIHSWSNAINTQHSSQRCPQLADKYRMSGFNKHSDRQKACLRARQTEKNTPKKDRLSWASHKLCFASLVVPDGAEGARWDVCVLQISCVLS